MNTYKTTSLKNSSARRKCLSSPTNLYSHQQDLKMFSTHFKLAIAAEEENNTNEAFTNFQKCYELDPSKKFTKDKYLSYFKRNFENENNKKAQDELKLIGNEYMQNSKFEEALIAYTAAIDLDPSGEAAAAIYSNRSLCFYNLEKYQEAYDDGCMASLLRPEWPRGWMRRATAGMKIENYEDAHECYEKYFELDAEGAKSDADVVRNRKLVKSIIDQIVINKRKKEQRLDKLKNKLLSIKDHGKLEASAGLEFVHHVSPPSNFDADVLRLVIEHALNMERLLPNHTEFKWVMRSVDMSDDEARILNVPLMFLFSFRAHFVGTKTITSFDSVVRFLIDEMVKKNASFPPSALAFACWSIQPNPDIILALLHTGKVDVNALDRKGYTPLTRVVQASNKFTPDGQVPSAVMASLHALLNWGGIDVNVACKSHGLCMTPLMLAQHPDVAKLLLRHGANVHAEGTGPSLINNHSFKVNALTVAVQATGTPHQAELLRVLIAAGARLIVDGAEQKSSGAMLGLLHPKDDQWVTNEALQILLQLNKVQGLEMTFQDTSSDVGGKNSFLCVAVANGAPLRIIEQLCRWDPSVINEYSYKKDQMSSCCTLLELAIMRAQNPSEYADALKVVKVLLDLGADLLQESRFEEGVYADRGATVFYSCGDHLVHRSQLPLDPFFDLVKEKFGEEYLEKCVKTMPAPPKETSI